MSVRPRHGLSCCSPEERALAIPSVAGCATAVRVDVAAFIRRRRRGGSFLISGTAAVRVKLAALICRRSCATAMGVNFAAFV
jgi:hypothetical protein